MMDEKRYNGWKNYFTWAVNLWLTNEEGTYNYINELAKQAKREGNPAGALADMIKDVLTDNAPELPASVYSDLLGAALERVDYYEIAETWLKG